jgi:CcmD family protein
VEPQSARRRTIGLLLAAAAWVAMVAAVPPAAPRGHVDRVETVAAYERSIGRASFAQALVAGVESQPAGDPARPQRRAPPAQEEFVPIDELPPEEQLPAAPLLVAAYAFVWIAAVAYLWSIWRRLGKVERELAEVERRLAERGP